MKFNTFFLTIMTAFFLADTAFACSLTELQQAAVANRQVVEKYKATLEREKSNVTLARSGFYPSLDASYRANQLDEDSLFESKENSVAYGAITWNIFSGFKDMYGVKSAKLLRDAEQYKLKGVKQDIQLNVALRYLAIFDAKASLQVAEDSYNTLSKVYKDTENRFNVGLINKNELLKIKVDLDNAEIGLKKARAAVTKNIRFLQREVNAKVKIDELCFTEFEVLPEVSNPEIYQERMLQQRSEIKVLEDVVDAASMQINAERGGFYPRLDITSSYQKYDSDYISGNGDTHDEELRNQLTLSINLFDGRATSSRVRKAKMDAKAAEYDLEELKNDLVTELNNLFLDYDISKGNVVVTKSSIAQAEENLRISELSYKEGLSTTSDLLDAITSLSRAKYNHVAATSELFANYYKITRTVDGF